jgi:glutamine synthetase
MARATTIDAAAHRVVSEADEAKLRLVRFLWCGNDGTVRAKASARAGLAGRMRTGIGLTVGMQAMNGLDHLQPVEGMGPVGEIRLVPDPSTFRVLPYAPHSGAMLVDHVTLSGEPYAACPRQLLKRQSARLAEWGGVLRCAFENEFSLAERDRDGVWQPADRGLCFSTIGMTASQGYVDALAEALDEQGIALEQYYAELGHGQQEISTSPAPALRAADEQILVRETIRGVAAQRGLAASLAPKPWLDQAGNGTHVHFSLWDTAGERNLFHDPDSDDRLSATARSFTAGVLDHLPALCGLTVPSHNSYARLLPQFWAGAFACWGHDNREAPLRVPSLFWGMEEASTNVELKACDASCNPYLALGGLIAAGIDGIEQGLDLPAPVEVDPSTIDEAERERRGIARLPQTAHEALDALAADDVLVAALGPLLATSYLAVRRSEAQTHAEADDAFRQAAIFLKY